MGKEIETKIPLTKEEFYNAFLILSGKVDSKELLVNGFSLLFKSDAYYSQYKTHKERLQNEPKVIRIRKERFFLDVNVNSYVIKNNFVKDYESLIKKRDELLTTCEYNEDSYFTIKHKVLDNGVEYNQEYETKVQDACVLEKFFESTKYDCWFNKEKICFSSLIKMTQDDPLEFHAELETVFGLPYLEVEYTKETNDPLNVKNQLEKCIALLGANPNAKDNLSWMEIINNIKKH